MAERGLLALLPFLVKGALSLRVLRSMRARGMNVSVAFTNRATSLAPDEAEDLRGNDRLIDLGAVDLGEHRAVLEREIRERHVGLVLQIGAASLYKHLPYLREKAPGLRILDTLYNEVGHSVNHFLYERCFDGVVVESRAMQEYVERCSSKEHANALLVESGIDVDAFTPGSPARRGAGLVLGFVGRMSAEKNPIGFIELCERLHAVLPSISCRIIGGGPGADEVRRRVEASSAREVLEYQGYQPDLLAALRELDVLVVPSKLDGRPNVVMEANACGVPVLGAPVGGIPELIEDGHNGYLLPPGDYRRFIEIVTLWCAQPDRLAAIKASSRATAERMFDQRRMMDRYEEVFRGCLGDARVRSRPVCAA